MWDNQFGPLFFDFFFLCIVFILTFDLGGGETIWGTLWLTLIC